MSLWKPSDGEEALAAFLLKLPFVVMLCDIRMPGMDGLTLIFRQVKEALSLKSP